MKTLKLTVALFMAAMATSAKNIYVATDGNDSNDATKAHPLATIKAAQEMAQPGDTVFLRGGTYRMGNDDVMDIQEKTYACVFDLNKSGRQDKRIVYAGVPGERPVFDLTDVKPEGKRVSVFYINADWLHLKNFDIVGTQVTIKEHTQSEGVSIRRGGSNNIIEDVAIHDGMSIGVYITKGSNNLVLNCDAYNNYDSVSEDGKGGNSDGFGCHVDETYSGNVFRGCRAWCNSDDGFDLIKCKSATVFDHCWAFFNGYKDFNTKTPGDGNGFKAGGYGKKVQDADFTAPRHTINNCIAYSNKANGFYANHHLGGNDWLNNTAWKNKVNYNMVNQKAWDEAVDVAGYGHTLQQNVSLQGIRGDYDNIDTARCTIGTNSFLPTAMTVTEADFENTDYTQLTAPRKADGSLPDIQFLRLRQSSPLYGMKMGWQFDSSSTPAAISHTTADHTNPNPHKTYRLDGTAATHTQSGLIVANGKKTIHRK